MLNGKDLSKGRSKGKWIEETQDIFVRIEFWPPKIAEFET